MRLAFLFALLSLSAAPAGASSPGEILRKARRMQDDGKTYEAALILRAAAVKYPGHPGLRVAEQNAMIGAGQYAEALAYYQALYERAPTGFHAWLFARIDEDRVRARETVARALRAGRSHPGVEWLSTSQKAADLAAAGKIEAAQKLVEDSEAGMEIDPASVFQERAGYAMMLGDRDKGLALVKEARRLDPMDPGIHATLIGVLTLRGDVDALREAIYNPPRNQRYGYVVAAEAMMNLKSGEKKRALALWREVLELPHDPYGLHAARASAYAALGDQAASSEEVKAQSRLDPADAGSRLSAAFDLMPRDRAAAEAAIRKEYERNPRILETIRAMGWVEFSHGRLSEAIALYDRALALAPGIPDLWVGRGAIRTHQKRPDLAEKDFSRALALYHRHPGALRELGQMHLEAGQWARCEEEYAPLALGDEPDAGDLRQYARCCRGNGHEERGIAALERALDAAPGAGPIFDLALELGEAKRAAKSSASRYPRDEAARVVRTEPAAFLADAPPAAYELDGRLTYGHPWGRQTALLPKGLEIRGTRWAPDGRALYYLTRDREIRRVDVATLSSSTVWSERGIELDWFEVSPKTSELVAITARSQNGRWIWELRARPIKGGSSRVLHVRSSGMGTIEGARRGAGKIFVVGGGNLRVDPAAGKVEEFPIVGCTLDWKPSPDGRRGVCVSYDATSPENGELNLYDVDARKKTPLEISGRRPAWSPDGRSIAYVWRDRQLRVLDLESRSVTAYELPYEFDPLPKWDSAGNCGTDWSADGRFVFFSAGPRKNPSKSWKVRNSVIVDTRAARAWSREGLLPTFEFSPVP